LGTPEASIESVVDVIEMTKSNIMIFLGLALVSSALPELLPNVRPAVRSAIKLGIDLLTESEVEAEAELIQSLVAATMQGIRQDLSKPATGPEPSEAIRKRIEHFKRQARIRARRWTNDHDDRHRRYRRHVARLESALAKHKRQAGPRDQRILDYAFAALGSEA
jgi:hypothetical protein